MTGDEGWEARMSARAKNREVQRLAAERAADLAAQQKLRSALPDGDGWLHGQTLADDGLAVCMDGTVRCAGCGQLLGTASFVIDGSWSPGPEPDWPFSGDDCPIHSTRPGAS